MKNKITVAELKEKLKNIPSDYVVFVGQKLPEGNDIDYVGDNLVYIEFDDDDKCCYLTSD